MSGGALMPAPAGTRAAGAAFADIVVRSAAIVRRGFNVVSYRRTV
jgi:hypothetical protein